MPAMRDGNGRFVRGTSGGPGRPKRDTELTYQAATQQGCTPHQWLAVVKRATEDALQGDASARTFLAKYLLPQDGTAANSEADYQGVEMTASDWTAVRAELEAWDRGRPVVDLDRFLYASGPPAPVVTEVTAEPKAEPEAPAVGEWDSDLYGELDHELLKHSGRRP